LVEGVEDVEVLEQFVFNTFTPRRHFTNNLASLVVDLPDFFDKLDFDIHYSNRDISYKQRRFDGSERNEDLFGGTLIIKPLPKIRIRTGFDYTIVRYDSRFENDSTYRRIPFNISWKPTVKSNFFLNTRFNTRDYGRRSPFENFSGYDATLGYGFNVTEKDELTLKFERSLKEQQFQRAQEVDPGPPLEIVTLDRGDNNPYFYTQIDIYYVHRFTENFSFTFSPAFQHIRFLERELEFTKNGAIGNVHEKVNTIRFEVIARYDAPREWLFGEISYSYQDRRSNLEGGDLIKNVGQISVGLSF
jgi:hypothetical protein